MYRYGDATPFPFDDNFIETIVAATEACVGLFLADMEAEERRRKVDQIRTHADEELKRLAVLGRAVNASIRPMLPSAKAERTSEATAQRIQQLTDAAVRQATIGVERRRDAAIRAAMGNDVAEMVVESLAKLLVAHQLPKTKWLIRWVYDAAQGTPAVVLRALNAACDLTAEFTCALPDAHTWSGPVRVGDLTPHLEIELQREPTLLRRKSVGSQRLHKYYIVEAEHSPDRSAFELRRYHNKPSDGFRVVMREEDQALPRITRIAADGSKTGNTLTISGDAAVALDALWQQIEKGLHDLRRHRDALVSGAFEERGLELTEEPAQVAEALLGTIAPVVREMRLRSRVPGELILKRDTGDGRREELFVPRAQLEAKFAPLPERYQRVFESVGLSSEATTEFVGREFPLAVPRGPEQAPRRRRATPAHAAPPPPPRPPTMSSLPDLPMPPVSGSIDDDDDDEPTVLPAPAIPAERSGRIARVDTDAITATA